MRVGDVKPFRPDGCNICGTRLGESCVHVRCGAPSVAVGVVLEVPCEHCAVPAGTPCPYPIGYCTDRLGASYFVKRGTGPGKLEVLLEEFTVEVLWYQRPSSVSGPFSRDGAERFAASAAANPAFRSARIIEASLRTVPQ